MADSLAQATVSAAFHECIYCNRTRPPEERALFTCITKCFEEALKVANIEKVTAQENSDLLGQIIPPRFGVNGLREQCMRVFNGYGAGFLIPGNTAIQKIDKSNEYQSAQSIDSN